MRHRKISSKVRSSAPASQNASNWPWSRPAPSCRAFCSPGRAPISSCSGMRHEDGPHTAIFFFLEEFIAQRALLQRHPVRQQEGWVQPALLNVREEGGDVTLALLLGGTQGECLVDDGAH